MADQNDQPENLQPGDDPQAEQHVKEIMELNQPEPAIVPTPAEPIAPATPAPTSAPVLNPDDPVIEEPVVPVAEPEEPVIEVAPEPEPATDIEPDEVVDDTPEAEDETTTKDEDQAVQDAFVMKPSIMERFKNGLANWWGNPRKRIGTLVAVVILFIAVAIVPVTRYAVLNTIGLRGHAQLRILDATNDLPLPNVTVSLAGQTAKTDVDGKVILQHLKLGKQTLTIKKLAFAAYSKTITVNLNGNTLSDVELKAVGTQFSFLLTDYVSGKPIAGAQVTSGESSALSDKVGKLILTVQPSNSPKLKVLVSDVGYRTDQFEVDTTLKTPTNVQLVTNQKDVFVSKQSGRYDLYSIDVDGKNKTVLLAGTGIETQNMALSVSPDNMFAGFVSTRDNQRDSDGFLLSTLTIVNLENGTTQTVDHAESISLIGWSKDKLVYELIVAGASAANQNRERLFAYDTNLNKKTQLAGANYFNGSAMIGDTIYYAVSGTDPAATASFNKVNSDATGKQTIVKQEMYGIYRTGYNVLTLQTTTGWVTYTIGDSTLKPGGAPNGYISRAYFDNAEGTDSLWVDMRDGKGVLLSNNIKTNHDTTLTSQSGLNAPLRWLNDQTIVYRVSNNQETADYVLSLVPGSQPKKITDVTDTTSLAGAH